EVLDIPGRDERQAGRLGELPEVGVDSLLDVDPRVLDLEVRRIRPEDVTKICDLLLGLGRVSVLERFADTPARTAGEGNQTRGVTLQELPVDPRLVVVALEVARGREPDQIRVALIGLG